MQDTTKISLGVSEIAGLWNNYMNDSLSICMFKHFLNNIDDEETKTLLQDALKLSEQHVSEIESIFNKENLPVPDAFGEDDVNMNAPRLFTDSFYLFYLSHMSGFGMDGYSLITRYTSRPDIRDFFINCLTQSSDVFRKASDLRLSKGIYIKSPMVQVSKKITYIEKQSFLKGLVEERRTLIAREVTNVFSGILISIFWRAILTGFGQVALSARVKEFMFKGRDIASAHFEEFSNLLNKEHIPVSSASESYITDTTTPPFTDKLMMYQIITLCNFAMGVNGAATSSSMRSDLVAIHVRFGAEIIKYASEGADIMIDYGWMEQPPQVVRHENLTTV